MCVRIFMHFTLPSCSEPDSRWSMGWVSIRSVTAIWTSCGVDVEISVSDIITTFSDIITTSSVCTRISVFLKFVITEITSYSVISCTVNHFIFVYFSFRDFVIVNLFAQIKRARVGKKLFLASDFLKI